MKVASGKPLLISALWVALLASACHTTPTTGTLNGEFRASGGLVGAGGFRTPTAGMVQVRQPSGHLVTALRVGASGRFSVRLAAGSYSLTGLSVMASGRPCATANTVVRPRLTTQVNLVCVMP
jgi:hypothetical protein